MSEVKENVNVAQDDSFHSDYATTNVPVEKRRGFYGTAAVWIGWCISLSAFATGTTIANGCSLGVGLMAVLLGNLLLVCLASACGIIGFRSGRSTYSLYEGMFGSKGCVIVNVVNGISTMSFIGVLLDLFATNLAALFPWFPKILAVLIFSGCILLTSINGFKGLEMLSRIAAPALIIFALWGLVLTFLEHPENLQTWVPVEPIPFITAMGAAVATWIGGASMAADITRYSRSRGHVIGGAICGYILGSGLFEGVAVITAVGAGAGSLVTVMATMGLLAPAVIVLGLALWTTTDNNIYSAALAFTNASKTLGLKISKPVWTVICVLIAFVVSLFGLANNFSGWLSFTGSLCGPLAGMMIAHYLVLGRGKTRFYIPNGFRLSGWISWLVASIGSQFTGSSIPTVAAIIMGFVLYIILSLALDRKGDAEKVDAQQVTDGEIWLIPSSEDVAEAVKAASK